MTSKIRLDFFTPHIGCLTHNEGIRVYLNSSVSVQDGRLEATPDEDTLSCRNVRRVIGLIRDTYTHTHTRGTVVHTHNEGPSVFK